MLNYYSVYGDNYDEESELVGNGKASETPKNEKQWEGDVEENEEPVASSGSKKKKSFSLF
jgi:hypothetical protein